ncbi:hypothetical protein EDD86DRAFT_247692 [Gorgonomyces haynaldii]|nr:hypothetical protein EDD86DRAFT_247692 [Gorgonomyces haynaldii]
MGRSVFSLHPDHAVVIVDSATAMQAAELMALKNIDCLLAVSEDGNLTGILTDKDIAYKVVAEGKYADAVMVSDIMTRDPIAVFGDRSRNEALNLMLTKRIRHLPVISEEEEEEAAIFLLDFSKCAFDHIGDFARKLNFAHATNALAAAELIKKKESGTYPNIAYTLANHSEGTVRVTGNTSIQTAAQVMKESKSAGVLIVDGFDENARVDGVLTTKDIVRKVLVKNLSTNLTFANQIMTTGFKAVTPTTDILEAMTMMRDGKFNHLPVTDKGIAVGLVDAMKLTLALFQYLLDAEPIMKLVLG